MPRMMSVYNSLKTIPPQILLIGHVEEPRRIYTKGATGPAAVAELSWL
jgi:hypothetical protein